jgi:signal transduction histidine kinase
MPDQDRQSSDPDSASITIDDRAGVGREAKNDPPNGSIHRVSFRREDDRPRLDLAVDNGAFRTSLRDLVRGRRDSDTDGSPEGGPSPTVARVIEAQEETARRIAQGLHDEASQMLAIVYLELANIARNSPEPTSERIDRVIQHLDRVSEQIRGLSHELHPMVLEQNGLLPALKQLARGVGTRSGLDVQVSGEAPDLAPVVEAAIYRVVQEALTNVMRHAQATKVEIRLWQTEDRVHCSVRDDGVGFKPTAKGSEGGCGCGLGFVGINERVDALGGDVHILSGARKGMELKLGIPL